jgi:hypothetical protein
MDDFHAQYSTGVSAGNENRRAGQCRGQRDGDREKVFHAQASSDGAAAAAIGNT